MSSIGPSREPYTYSYSPTTGNARPPTSSGSADSYALSAPTSNTRALQARYDTPPLSDVNIGAFQSVRQYRLPKYLEPTVGGTTVSTTALGGGAAVAGAILLGIGALPFLIGVGVIAGGAALAAAGTGSGATFSGMSRAGAASLRKHIFSDLGIVATRAQSEQIVSQLKHDLGLLSPGRQRYVLQAPGSVDLRGIVVDGASLSYDQQSKVRQVLMYVWEAQMTLRANVANEAIRRSWLSAQPTRSAPDQAELDTLDARAKQLRNIDAYLTKHGVAIQTAAY